MMAGNCILPELSNSIWVHEPLLCQGQLKTAPLSVTVDGVWSDVFALGAPTSMFNLETQGEMGFNAFVKH